MIFIFRVKKVLNLHIALHTLPCNLRHSGVDMPLLRLSDAQSSSLSYPKLKAVRSKCFFDNAHTAKNFKS